MQYQILHINDIVPDPKNFRKVFRGIEELAESIHEHGLLQNLVVRPEMGSFILTAGERRWKAIKLLVEQNRHNGMVPCLIKEEGSADAFTTQIVENVQREDVPIWRQGMRFVEMMEADITQAEIAVRIKKPNWYVSKASQIARGLAPMAVKKLDALGHKAFMVNDLVRVASLHDGFGEPDEEAQLDYIEKLSKTEVRRGRKSRGRPPVPPGTVPKKYTIVQRFEYIQKGHVTVPAHARPYVDTMMAYLCGEKNRLEFELPAYMIERMNSVKS